MSYSKVIELSILELIGQHLLSSQLQLGFKPGLSTTICMGILIRQWFLNIYRRVQQCMVV